MSYLPPHEALFPLSDDLRGVGFISLSGDMTFHDMAMIEIPRGFLAMDIYKREYSDPMETTQ